ncbi:MAG: hypothetical protein AAB774_00965 [Patescibacteria group bacterium]
MVTVRKDAIVTGGVYHIFTRSIAGFEIFRSSIIFERFIDTLQYYNQVSPSIKLSHFLDLSADAKRRQVETRHHDPLVQMLCYCLMPTHPHLILKQLKDCGISIFMSNTLNSFTRYFNISHQRKGPLWESEFKNVIVDTDEQLLHLSRYIHLNPVSAGLVTSPRDWKYSSFGQYISDPAAELNCNLKGVLDINPSDYAKFVNGRAAYQRSLSLIKSLLIENYSG